MNIVGVYTYVLDPLQLDPLKPPRLNLTHSVFACRTCRTWAVGGRIKVKVSFSADPT